MILRLLLASIGAALVLVAAADGAPSWLAPVQISSGDRALGPELALSGKGDGLVVWDQEVGADCATSPASLSCIHIVEASSRVARSDTWGTPLEIDRPGVGSTPRGAINASGNATIIWVHDIGVDRVLQATYRSGHTGQWPEPNDLSASVLQVRNHRIALAASGDAVAVWAQRADTTFAVDAEIRSAATGVWGAPVRLSGSGTNATGGPSLALAPGDSALVAWIEDGVVRVSDGELSTGVWEPPVTLSNGADGDPQLAVDAAGDAVVVWAAGDVVEAAFRPTGGSWAAPVEIGGVPNASTAAPQVAIDGSGNVVALWIGARVQSAARLRATGQWSRAVDVSTPDPDASDPGLAVDTAGNAVAVWSSNGITQAAIRPAASGAWQRPLILANVGASGPRVAMDSIGHAVAVWNWTTSSRVLVMSDELVGSGPVIAGLEVPRKGTAHARVTFSVKPAPWASPLSGPPVWRFGDGRSTSGVRVRHAYAHSGRYIVSVSQADAAGGTSTAKSTIKIAHRRVASGR